MALRRTVTALALALGLAATSAGCAPDEERTVELVEEMAELFARHQGDCDRLGAELDAFATDNAARFADLKRIGRLEGDARKTFDARYGARLQAAMKKLMAGASACMTNPKVEGALRRIE
jgi:hypothetical protein